MNALTTVNQQLPETIEEKTAYVLFGPDALNAYRKKLKAVKEKFGISSEQYKQIQLEAQETAENLLLFSVDIGNEMQQIEKASGGDRKSENFKSVVNDNFEKTKAENIRNMGFTTRQARDFQALAKHPETVQKAIEYARAEDRIVTRQDALNLIAPPKSKAQKDRERIEAMRERVEQREQEIKDSGVVDFQTVKQNESDKEFIRNSENYDNWKEFEALCRTAKKFAEKGEDALLDTFRMAGMWGNKESNYIQEMGLNFYLKSLTDSTNRIKAAIMEVLADGK